MNDFIGETSDWAIIREIREGNVNAFESLMTRYEGHISAIVAKHVPPESAQEVIHETFIRIYQSLGNYKEDKPFQHWLSRIAVRSCYDFWRAHYKNREKPLSAVSAEDRQRAENILSGYSRKSQPDTAGREDDIRMLRWALDRLSAEDRMVLSLTCFEGYSTAETAGLLGWSAANVKIRAFRARKALRKILAAAYGTAITMKPGEEA